MRHHTGSSEHTGMAGGGSSKVNDGIASFGVLCSTAAAQRDAFEKKYGHGGLVSPRRHPGKTGVQ